MCGSLASTVSDSENDDDAFVGAIASWFVLIDDRCKIKLIPNTNTVFDDALCRPCNTVYTRHRQTFKFNLTVYVGLRRLRDDFCAQSSPIYRRVYMSAGAVIRSLESRFRGQKSTH